MKSAKILPLALCLALGACAAPTAPTIVAVASEGVTDKNFANDAATCRASAQSVTDEEFAQGRLDLQPHYNAIYAQCMANKGYHIEAAGGPRYYGPGPYYYGPGPYYYGPRVYGGYWGPRW